MNEQPKDYIAEDYEKGVERGLLFCVVAIAALVAILFGFVWSVL